MNEFKQGDIIQGKTSKNKHRIARKVFVGNDLYWVTEGSKFFAGDWKPGGDVDLKDDDTLRNFYEPVPTFDDTLTEGEIWLADHEDSGLVNVFVARVVHANTGVRLHHAVRGTWASHETWGKLSGFTNFRRAIRSDGDYL